MMLSILIPARNEEWLSRTVEDLLENIEGETEILIGLDGAWASPPIKDNPKVKILHYSESIGQRAMTNQLARLSTAKYLMKVDAHCAFDKGFDVKLMDAIKNHDNWTVAPVMRNLHVFNWLCKNGHKRYQSPSGACKECGEPTEKEVVWIAKTNPQSTSYLFDPEPHFQYFNEYKKTEEYQRMIKDGTTWSMSLQGSCFMLTRDKYWELNICDENYGSWGSQGIEVAVKTWLSGGEVHIVHSTWYAHLFRTQGGDFGFPYPQSGNQVDHAKKTAREMFFNGTWDRAVHPLSWLIEKFWPLPNWTQEDLRKLKKEPTKGILYYSDNQLNMRVASECRKTMLASGLPITSVTLKPTNFGKNIHFKGDRGYLTMAKQILIGLEAMSENIVYFCEHDVMYHPDHFAFTPSEELKWYYNGNYWFLRLSDGFAVNYDVSPLSGLVVYRETAIKHFKERIAYMEEQGENLKVLHMGFEPFTHGRVKWNFWCNFEVFMPENPNVDITHGSNVTWKRWREKDFIKKPKFWNESNIDNIKGWSKLRERLMR